MMEIDNVTQVLYYIVAFNTAVYRTLLKSKLKKSNGSECEGLKVLSSGLI